MKTDKSYGKKAVCLIAFFLLLLSNFAFAQPVAGIPKDKYLPDSLINKNELNMLPALGDTIRKLSSSFEKGDTLSVNEQIEMLKSWRKMLRSKNLFFVSRYLAAKAGQMARAGDAQRAVETLRDAVSISPDDYQAGFLLARYTFGLDWKNAKGYLEPAAFAALAYFKNPFNIEIFTYKAVTIITPALFIAFILFVSAVFIVYRKPLAADIRRVMPFEMGKKATGVSILLVILAILIGGGVFWAAIAIPFFILGYVDSRSRTVMVFFLLFIAALPFTVKGISRGIALDGSDTARAISYYKSGNWEPATLDKLGKAYTLAPDDPEILLALGNLHRRMQSFDSAQQLIKRIYKNDGRNLKAIMELGNVYFGKKDYKNAEQMYKKALELSPSLLEAHFNLSNTYVQQFRTEEGAAEFTIAMQIDKAKMETLVTAGGGDKSAGVASLIADLSESAPLKSGIKTKTKEINSGFRPALMGDLKIENYLAGVAAYFILFFIASAAWKRLGSYTLCPSCGVTFLPPFTMKAKTVAKCNQCLVLSSRQKVVASKKTKKRAQIRKYKENMAKNANRMDMLFPGFGSVYYGSYIFGAILLAASSVFLIKLASVLFLFGAGYKTDFSMQSVEYAAWGAALIFYYLFALLITRRSA